MKLPIPGEILWISLASALCFFLRSEFPSEASLGALCMVSAVALMTQSLIRDLWLLRKSRANAPFEPREVPWFCLESSLGILIVVVGALLYGSGNPVRWQATPLLWCGVITGTLLCGFLIKDWVIDWSNGKLRKDPDHLNLLVRFRKPVNP